jgi:hypothetical protein
LQGRAALTVRSLDREGAPQAVVAWGLFRIPKGLKCVECREAGRGAGVHAPQAEFTFRTYCRHAFLYRIGEELPVRTKPPGGGRYA